MLRTLVLASILTLLPAARADEAGLKAGAFAIDVTPKTFPISTNGGFEDRLSTKVDDPLHARCLVLDDGKHTIAIAVIDSCAVSREIVEGAKKRVEAKTGIPTSHVLISATHTHSAPTLANVFQSKADLPYCEYLTARIAEGIETAWKARVPARLGFGKIDEPSQLFNRRWKMEDGTVPPGPFEPNADKVRMNPGFGLKGLIGPNGPVDPQLSLLSVQTRDGKPLCVLANYGLHYVGGNPNLSADYFGAFADRLKQLIDPKNESPKFVGIMSNGTSGDVNNIDFAAPPKKAAPGEQIRFVSEVVARSAMEALAGVTYRSDVKLSSVETELPLKVRKPDAKQLASARETLKAAEGKKALSGYREVFAAEAVALNDYPEAVPVAIQAHRIGDIAIVGIPCEVFAQIGLDIRRASPLKNQFTISLANGYNGYLPTPEQHAVGGYETWRARSSYLEVEASVKISKAVGELLAKLAK